MESAIYTQYHKLFDKLNQEYIDHHRKMFRLVLKNCKNTKEIEEVIMLKYNHKGLYTSNACIQSLKIDILPYTELGQIAGWRGNVIIDADKKDDIEMFVSLFWKTGIQCDCGSFFGSTKLPGRRKVYRSKMSIYASAKHFPIMKDCNEKTLVWNALSDNNLEGKIIKLS